MKRVVDVVGSLTGLLVLSPMMGASALAVWAGMGRPVFFRQQRPGRHGKPFTLYKFRTMRPPNPDEVWFRTDARRLTPVGRFLRKTSLDELPTLFNVLRGDMSLVGPRPLLMEYLAKYTPAQARRHEVPPGVTGWAQIHGRNDVPFSERLALDVWYVDQWSLALDTKILWRTLSQVLFGQGVRSGQQLDDVDDLGLSADRRRVVEPKAHEPMRRSS